MGSIDANDTTDSLAFPELPSFPTDVPTIPLLRINLARLLAGDPAEDEKLWRACCDLGFFYLDLRSHVADDEQEPLDGEGLLQSARDLFDLAQGVFDLPVEEKQKYDLKDKGSYFGYKGFGQGVIDKQGTKDRNEFWNVSKDDVLGPEGPEGRLPNPPLLMDERNREVMGSFMRRSHAVVRMILGRLDARLGLKAGTLEGLHRLSAISGDQVRWVKSPPQKMDDRQTALGEHTDFGSVTVLFNRLGGLQVLPPGDEAQWAYVKPLRGHCIINLGDAMVKFTAGVLRSNIHRVVNPPGQQESETRFSLVYFSRPEDDVILKVLEGSEMIDEKAKQNPDMANGEPISAKQWILNRALGRRVGGDWKKSEGTDKQRLDNHKRDSAVAAS